MLNFLYRTRVGRVLLKPLTSRPVSAFVGAFMNTRASKALIKGFVKKNAIDLSEYEQEDWRSFNEFFYRRVKDGTRPIEASPEALVAPCDGLLTVYPIKNGLVVPVKQSEYSIKRLLDDEKLAQTYLGGLCLVFRLCVNHYHRYAYVESGRKSENRFISGKLHTVQPIALELSPVFVENCRDFVVIETETLGKVVQMEVGAMMVGKIENLAPEARDVTRGEEKGRFLFGGSTVIVLIEANRAKIDAKIVEASEKGEETPVKLGEKIGDVLR